MGQYSALAGKRVEASYRAGDLRLSVCGVLVSETAQGISLEDRFSHHGKEKTIRVEIPHAYLLYLRECPQEADRPARSTGYVRRGV
jgi:hypothetical protein